MERPGQAQSRLEVVQVLLADRALRVRDRALSFLLRGRLPSGSNCDCCSPLRRVRRKVCPSHPQIQCQTRPHLPVVLEVQFLVPLPRHEYRQLLAERRARHFAHQECCEVVSGVLRERQRSSTRKVVLARGQNRGVGPEIVEGLSLYKVRIVSNPIFKLCRPATYVTLS